MFSLARVIRRSQGQALRNQFEYLKSLPGSPNQLKWKQFANQLISHHGDMDLKGIKEIIRHVSRSPCQKKRHEIFLLCASRFMQNTDDIRVEDRLDVLRSFLHACIDITDPEFKKFKVKTLTKARLATDTFVKDFVASIYADENPVFSKDFIYCLSLALSKGWSLPECFDLPHLKLDQLIDNAIMNLIYSPIDTRGEVVWSLGVLAKYGLLDPSRVQSAVRRSVVETDLIPFQLDRNYTNIPSATKDGFVTILQLWEGMKNLQLETSHLEDLMTKISSFRDSEIACHLIWWSALSDSTIHPFLVNCVKTCLDCVDSLDENQRWMVSNGLRHLLTLEKSSGNCVLSVSEMDIINFCVDRNVFEKQKRAAVSWRHGGDKQFIRQL
jgi:hypothetical protein